MDIDPSKPVPIYFQVKTLVLDRINAGVFLPGDRLPTEHELCAEYGISRTPVHRAFAELANEGVIVRKRRYGSFVNPHWLADGGSDGRLRVAVANEEWTDYVESATPPGMALDVLAVGYPNLHRHISRSVAGGDAPDLMVVDSVWVAEFAEAGILAPLEELAPAWLVAEGDDFVPGYEIDGETFAISAETNVGGLWYRRQVLDALEASPPRTWSELTALAKRVMASGLAEVPVAAPLGINAGEATTYCIVAMLAANGARVIDDGHVVLHSPAAVRVLENLVELVVEELLEIRAVAYEWDRAPEMLAKGRAALSIGGSYEAPLIAESARMPLAAVMSEFGFAPLPTGPDGGPGTVLGGMAYAIPRQSRRAADAMRLLRALVDSDRVVELALATGTLPGRRSALEAVATRSPLIRIAADLVGEGVVRPRTTSYNRVSQQLQLMVEAVVLDRMEPAAALRQAAGHIGAITGLPVASMAGA